MALLTVQQISATGLQPTYAAANAGGDTVKADDRTFLHFKNTNAATRDVTITGVGLCSQGSTHSRGPITIPATTGDVMIPLADRFNDPTTGVASITYTAATNVTVAAVRV
jgi:hypothetical protein